MPSVEYIAILDGENDVLEVNDDGSVNVKGISEAGSDLSKLVRGEEDTTSFNGSIASGGTQQLEVTTEFSDTVAIFIDDGTTGSKPSLYKMTQDVFKNTISDYQFYDEVVDEDARSWVDRTFGTKFRITIENTTNSSANYRITMTSYREMN